MERLNENQLLQKILKNIPKHSPEQLRELEKKAMEAKKQAEGK